MAPVVLLRQVLQHHGRCIPPFRLGATLEWLKCLPSGDVLNALDQCTVVLPRPGDGWYAPPPNSGYEATAGFPWGELTDAGVEQMRKRGAALVASGPAAAAWRTDSVLVRASNRRPSIGSAQAIVWGAVAPAATGGTGKEAPPRGGVARPVEVLLQQGEDLLPQATPGSPEYPPLLGDAGRALAAMEDEMLPHGQYLLDAIAAAGHKGGCMATDTRCYDWDWLCEAVVCLEGSGMPLELAACKAATELKRFNFLRWAAPLEAAGLEASIPIVGPLLRTLIAACDSALGGEASASSASLLEGQPGALAVYVAQADALVSLLGALGLTGTGDQALQACSWYWPRFGSSVEMFLVRDHGEVFLQFAGDGVPALTEDAATRFPYASFRQRVLHALGSAT